MAEPASSPDSPLRAARVASGLSIADAAASITRCPRTLARYEAGEHTPPQAVLIRLSQLYSVPVDVLWPAAAGTTTPAAIATDLVALGERLPARERVELRRIVGDLAALVSDLHRLAPAHG